MKKIFLSYSRSDSLEFAKELHRCLLRDGIDHFFDKTSIEWGDNYVLALERGLDECDQIIVILSPDFVNSEWTAIERTSSIVDDPKNMKKKFLPLLLKECEIPRFLKPIQYLDVTTDELFQSEYPNICKILGGTYRAELESKPKDESLSEIDRDAVRIELKINREFESYSEKDKNKLLSAIGELLKIEEGVTIIGVKKGSVIVTLEIPLRDLDAFRNIVVNNMLSDHDVTELILKKANAISNTSDTNASISTVSYKPWIDIMLKHCKKHVFPRRSTIVHAGDPNDNAIYYVLEGSVALVTEDDEGREIVLRYPTKGDFFGESNLFADDTCGVWAVAREKCHIAEITYKELQSLSVESPEMMMTLTKQLAKNLDLAHRKVRDLAFLDVTGRVASTLLDMAKQEASIMVENGIQISITKNEIARIVGISKKMIDKILNDLVQRGLIEIDGKNITIFGVK